MKHERSIISISLAVIMLISLCAVCASTSVTAAAVDNRNNKAPAQASSLVGAAVPGNASAYSIEADLYLFAKGADNALWWKHWTQWTKQWSGWTSIGGVLTSDPAASMYSSSPYDLGNMTVYVRGTDGAVWMASTPNPYYRSPSWTWTRIGGYVAPGTGPGASAYFEEGGANTPGVAVYVTGRDHALWHISTAHGWQNLGGQLTSSPAAAVGGLGGTLYAYVRGTDGALWQYNANTTKWKSYGGYILPDTGPAACWTPSTHHVFVTGGNHALYEAFPYAATPTWSSYGGYLTSSPTTTTSHEHKDPYTYYNTSVFARGSDYALWWYLGGTWTSIGGM